MSHSDSSSRDSSSKNQARQIQSNPSPVEQIDFVDYLRILWKWKWLVFLGSLIPTFFVGLFFYLQPRTYHVSYTYIQSLNGIDARILKDIFYSQMNLNILSRQLQNAGFDEYAEIIKTDQGSETLETYIKFEVSPSYFESTNLSEAETYEELQILRQAKGNLLHVNIYDQSNEHIRDIAAVIRDNYEQVVPIIPISNLLTSKIINLKEQMAEIEETRHLLNLQLDRKKNTLSKLKNSKTAEHESSPGEIVLQFENVGNNSAFLPLPYQIQAVETQIINLEEKIQENLGNYAHYRNLLALFDRLSKQVTENAASMTLDEYRTFLENMLDQYSSDDSMLSTTDSLQAYLKHIENQIARRKPVIEQPIICPLDKGTIGKIKVTFGISLILFGFLCFVLEFIKKN